MELRQIGLILVTNTGKCRSFWGTITFVWFSTAICTSVVAPRPLDHVDLTGIV